MKKKKKRLKWRKAVRQVMKNAAVAENKASIRRKGTRPSFNYRWEHVTTVVTLAVRLAEIVGADRDVVEAAAWLHDITKRDGKTHAKSGASFARAFLTKTDFPRKKIALVAQTIADHQGLFRAKPLTKLESMVLWDADKLSKIGLTAAFHWTGMALSGDRLKTMADLIANSQRVGWQKKTVASMHTKPARRAARARFKAFNRVWRELQVELRGDDLLPPRK